VVWGRHAVERLRELGQPARLVRHDGRVVTVNGWPPDRSPRPPIYETQIHETQIEQTQMVNR